MYFQTIKKLSCFQWLWCIEASWRLTIVQLNLKYRSVSYLESKLNSSLAMSQGVVPPDITLILGQAKKMHESVRLAARLNIGQPQCLPKSIVLNDMLHARAYPACLKIGVNKEPTNLSSHAWVELYGVMIAEPERVLTEFTKLK